MVKHHNSSQAETTPEAGGGGGGVHTGHSLVAILATHSSARLYNEPASY